MTLSTYIHLSALQVNTKSAHGHGTLLQDAVNINRTDFVRILLEYGLACIDYEF